MRLRGAGVAIRGDLPLSTGLATEKAASLGTAGSRDAPALPVADVLRHLSYADGCGQFALGREEHCPHGVQVAVRLPRAQELFA